MLYFRSKTFLLIVDDQLKVKSSSTPVVHSQSGLAQISWVCVPTSSKPYLDKQFGIVAGDLSGGVGGGGGGVAMCVRRLRVLGRLLEEINYE